jgi:hypothetical protein
MKLISRYVKLPPARMYSKTAGPIFLKSDTDVLSLEATLMATFFNSQDSVMPIWRILKVVVAVNLYVSSPPSNRPPMTCGGKCTAVLRMWNVEFYIYNSKTLHLLLHVHFGVIP